MNNKTDVEALISDLKQHLQENGGEVVYWGEEIATGKLQLATGNQSQSPSSSRQSLSSKADQLEALRLEEIGDCHRCPLGDTRTKLAFGVGNPEARVMFIGEGPGFDEDKQGVPFVGKAGQLLDKILAAISLDRTQVYIANIVKCHPMVDPTQPDKRGNDRPPSPEEIAECLPFLKKQISLIRPRFIVTLGGVATKALLDTAQGITKLRGQWTELVVDETLTIPVLPTFHPAALLRDETLKKLVWEDMKNLRDKLNAE